MMANVLANAAQLKPEIRLAQAVSQFEAGLSSDQKTTLRNYKSRVQNDPPSLSDVMRLTAEIDHHTSGRTGRGRCFGPRMTNFLYGVQQFAAIGDVMIGGSQNVIACGVWSLVRMSLLSIVNFSSYLENLSKLLMDAGRSAPRYESIALLYPRSKRLQSHLAEYFVVVVELCHMLYKFSQKSTMGQYITSLNDFDLKTYESDLNLWTNTIKEEVSFLVAEKVGEEAQESIGLRDVLRRGAKSLSLQQKLKARHRLLNFCSMYDYETTWKQRRKTGNATLFSRTSEYIDWKGQAESCTLLYTGKLGSGKSVLLANIVDDLNLYVQSKEIAVAYFFCRHDMPESLKAQTVIRSLSRQFLCTIPDLAMVADFLDSTISSPDFERIFDLLRRAVPPTFKAYFILDGLDECDHAERNTLILQLQKLQKAFAMLLCISLRLEPGNILKLSSEEFNAPRTISIPEDNPDIKVFIEAELESCIESKRLVIGDPSLILEIQDALLKGSQGMFLWVALQIVSLCARKTDDAIRRALMDLPKNLSETFSRILTRPDMVGRSYQSRILELVTTAQRPLRVEELREALAVIPGNTTWNPAILPNDIYSTLGCCGSLVIVDEEELTVRFVHKSVKQFLAKGFEISTNTWFTTANAEKSMANTIVTYLNYGIFETQLSTLVVPQMTVGLVPSTIVNSTLDSAVSVRRIALKLLRSRRAPNYDVSKTLVEAGQRSSSRPVNNFQFYSYGKSYWRHHVLYISEAEPIMCNLLVRTLERNMADMDVTDDTDWTPLLQAMAGVEAVLKVLLASSKVDINWKDLNGQALLARAAIAGNEVVVTALLRAKQIKLDLKDERGRTALSLAAGRGNQTIVNLLLETGKVEINSKDANRRTPLSWAASRGHDAIVKLLLGTGKAEIESKDTKYGQTPLLWAASEGRESVVKLLLETRKVKIESKDIGGQTSLSWAATRGRDAIVKLLLETGHSEIESKDIGGRTPLSRAAGGGYEATVNLLLEAGKVDIESKDRGGRTPLSWAAGEGREATVKLLLETGKVEIESEDIVGQTPLSWATIGRHKSVINILQLSTD